MSSENLAQERVRLQQAAIDLGRWQGGVDSTLADHTEDITDLKKLVGRLTWALITFSFTVAGSAIYIALTIASSKQ